MPFLPQQNIEQTTIITLTSCWLYFIMFKYCCQTRRGKYDNELDVERQHRLIVVKLTKHLNDNNKKYFFYFFVVAKACPSNQSNILANIFWIGPLDLKSVETLITNFWENHLDLRKVHWVYWFEIVSSVSSYKKSNQYDKSNNLFLIIKTFDSFFKLFGCGFSGVFTENITITT